MSLPNSLEKENVILYSALDYIRAVLGNPIPYHKASKCCKDGFCEGCAYERNEAITCIRGTLQEIHEMRKTCQRCTASFKRSYKRMDMLICGACKDICDLEIKELRESTRQNKKEKQNEANRNTSTRRFD